MNRIDQLQKCLKSLLQLCFYQLRRWTRPARLEGSCLLVQTWYGPLFVLRDDPDISQCIYRYGYYDLPLSRYVHSLKPGTRVLNIGANIGYFAMIAAQATSSPVHCFDPDPRSFEALKKNAELYTIIPVQKAMGSQNAPMGFTFDTVPANSSLRTSASGSTSTVEMLRGEEYLLKHQIDVIVMDVQGAELLVLQGMGDSLQRIDSIIFEFWPYGLRKTGSSPNELRQLLHQQGFILEQLTTSFCDPEKEWEQLLTLCDTTKNGRGFCNLLATRRGQGHIMQR